MLLQDRDPDIFHTMASHNPAASEHTLHLQDIPTDYQNQPSDGNNDNNNNNNSLDDIWATDDTPYYHHYQSGTVDNNDNNRRRSHQAFAEAAAIISDMPRLSQAHHTAGYRDGIALAKARTAQQGFDEGYPLGATIGARAGQLLGVLEGLAGAVGLHSLAFSSSSSFSTVAAVGGLKTGGGGGGGQKGNPVEEEARRIEGLLNEARRELSVQRVFDGEFWAGDGNWRYQVQGVVDGMGDEVEGVVVFPDVAEAHPLLRKWTGIVRAEAARYGVDEEVFRDGLGDDARREDAEEDERERRMRGGRGGQPAVRGGREALAW